ncbi:MAG TPA: GDSL-type esterase/lipase family protein [Candidatus Binatia bacterium]|nr:GDSL-type esterase/lipase family protein [Candidatus Binatia bacterium]
MKKALQNLGLVILSIVVVLLMFEGSVRLLPRSALPNQLRGTLELIDLYQQEESWFIPDRDLLYKIRPNTDFVAHHPDYTVRVKTNLNLDGIGFRGGSQAGKVWAVAVGDSFTFGAGVNLEETWAFNLAHSFGREVINLGIPGQGPAQYTRILKRYGLPMQPRVAFYGFYFNDLDASHRFYRLKNRWLPVRRYLRQYSITYNLVQGVLPSQRESSVPIKGDGVEVNFSPSALPRSLERQNRKFDQRWQVTTKELAEAIKASKEANVTFVLLYFPSRWEVYWELIEQQGSLPKSLNISRLATTVMAYCATQDILCLDLTEPLRSKARLGKQLYFQVDGHWNAEGHRVVADAIRKYLISKGAE